MTKKPSTLTKSLSDLFKMSPSIALKGAMRVVGEGWLVYLYFDPTSGQAMRLFPSKKQVLAYVSIDMMTSRNPEFGRLKEIMGRFSELGFKASWIPASKDRVDSLSKSPHWRTQPSKLDRQQEVSQAKRGE